MTLHLKSPLQASEESLIKLSSGAAFDMISSELCERRAGENIIASLGSWRQDGDCRQGLVWLLMACVCCHLVSFDDVDGHLLL